MHSHITGMQVREGRGCQAGISAARQGLKKTGQSKAGAAATNWQDLEQS